jgi:TIR domain
MGRAPRGRERPDGRRRMTPETTSRSELPEPKVFISYRREETSAYAGRLYDSMATEFGDGNVFMDVDLAPGIDFVERITNAVSACHVLIVVMGPRWATLTDEDGAVRIADAEDFVRLEVGTALRRSDVTVIPVLVSGARMPDGDDLPPDVRPLTRRNALELSDGRWRDDVRRLTSRLEELLAGTTAIHPAVEPRRNGAADAEPQAPVSAVSAVRIVVEGIMVAAVIGLVAGGLANALPDKLSNPDQVLKRMATWMPVALGIAIWLTVRFGQRSIARNLLLALGIGAVASALAGVISYYPDQKPSDLAIAVPAYAVLGAGMGGLMGLLWVPRRPGTGLAAGIAAGVFVGLVVPVGSDVPTLLVAVRAVIIISATLGALLWADAQATRSARASP